MDMMVCDCCGHITPRDQIEVCPPTWLRHPSTLHFACPGCWDEDLRLCKCCVEASPVIPRESPDRAPDPPASPDQSDGDTESAPSAPGTVVQPRTDDEGENEGVGWHWWDLLCG